MSKGWYCPNEEDGDSLQGRHQFFSRKHRQVVVKTYIGNGRQWALDRPEVLEDEPISESVCTTCGALGVWPEATDRGKGA